MFCYHQNVGLMAFGPTSYIGELDNSSLCVTRV